MNDEDILVLFKTQDEEGLHQIKLKYHSLFLYMLSQKGLSHEDIEECLNDIYLEIWKSIERYEQQKAELKTFVCAIARHVLYHRLRKNKAYQKHIVNTDLDIIPGKEPAVLVNKEILSSVISSLNKREKDIFFRKYYFMQSTEQIATELCTSSKAIESRLYRLRKKLQKKRKEVLHNES